MLCAASSLTDLFRDAVRRPQCEPVQRRISGRRGEAGLCFVSVVEGAMDFQIDAGGGASILASVVWNNKKWSLSSRVNQPALREMAGNRAMAGNQQFSFHFTPCGRLCAGLMGGGSNLKSMDL